MNRQNSHYTSAAQMTSTQATAMMEHDASALAAEMFDHFSAAMTMRQILGLYRNMCDTIGLRPGPLNEFYPKLKAKLKNWKAQALWKKFDARLSHRVYNKGTACTGTRVLIIGGGPCGLRTAIEAQLLGAKVVVVEKRDRISRNNVLHLWPFLIHDLRSLGAKKFYGKFCAGSIDHISIRQLQCILMKVALLLGVEFHEGVGFEKVIEPTDGCGWRALVDPPNHAVSHFEFDVLIGADGKRNTLEGFRRKEFRGKLAIAITANFINKRTEEEARVQEISGVAFIFNQSFFRELYSQTGIDLENIVYYKDDTHYFVMTAKKHSLLDKGVIIQDCSDPAELLHPNNVNTQKLQDYAREAADFSTKYQMPNLEFAVNHYGKPDVAMFDFTSMFAAENSSRVVVRKNYRLLSCLVGDSLLEPFWPSGSGCARGFLSGMDSAYAIKLFSNSNNSTLAVLAQRESIYRLLAQTTPENLHRDHGGYTLDPVTRYPNLNRQSVVPHQVKHLLDTDDPSLLEQTFVDTNAIQALPDLPLKTRKRRTADATPMAHVLLGWIKSHLKDQDFVASITEPSQCFTHGKVLCALIHRYRPDLVDWPSLQECSAEESNEIAFQIFEKEFNIQRMMSSEESLTLENIDIKNWLHYLELICEVFRGEIPHVKHPKLDYAEFQKQKNQNATTMAGFAKLHRMAAAKREAAKEENGASHVVSGGGRRTQKLVIAEKVPTAPSPQNVEHRRGRKRRSYEKYGNIEERMARLADIDANRIDRQQRRREQRKLQTENFLKSLHMLQANNYLRENDDPEAFEDYSIFMYRQNAPEFTDRVKELERKLLYPDRERGIPSAGPRAGGAIDDQFSDRIRNIEEKFTTKNAAALNKKPKDLLRAIGKIETTDWNVKEIEKKMEMSKKITDIGKSREKVPKWSREQFVARQNKMSKPERQDSSELKYKEIDNTLKALDKQLKEGSTLDRGERGKNKVASLAGTFGKKKDEENAQVAQKAGLILTSQGISEACHFCKQRVYLMEKISAEGLTLHRSCLKCHHCHTSLRLGGYAFDRDSPDGKFYCTQHYKLPPKDVKFVPKRMLHKQRQQEYAAFKAQRQQDTASAKKETDAMDNRGKTPERIEFENADGVSDGELQPEDQIMDENEWTDVNFRTGSEDEDETSSSDESDTDSDSEMFEDPVGVDAQTLQLASEWIDKRSTMQDSEDEFYGYSSEDDDADSQTEGEELAKAREMRMNEVKLQPPLYVLTDTETEGVKKAMTQSTEPSKFKSPSNLLSNSSLVLNPPPSQPNPKDELLKSDMMKKLSLKEKWLNEQAAMSQPRVQPMEVDHVSDKKKKEEKKSFFNGILSSVKHMIKPDKDKSKKSLSPPSGESVDLDKLIDDAKIDVDNFDELVVESDQPVPGCVNKRIQAFLQKQKSDEVREGADEILNGIKEGNDRLAKQMRDMEQRRFSDNMNAIKSSVVDSKVASIKEMNISKYFPTQQEKKPPAVAKNRDVKALKDVNLSKYFPQSSSPTGKASGSPTAQSTTSSAAASPLMPRKNINEIDLANYFPGTPVMTRKASVSSPPGSPMTDALPTFERRMSVISIPPPPPPPVAKKNVLSLQSVKKRPPPNENVDRNVVETKKEPSPVKTSKKKGKDEFNMFDQLLDGAIDLQQFKEKIEVELDNFESLLGEQKLERSPSKDYDKMFAGKSKSSSNGNDYEEAKKQRMTPERDEVIREVKKSSRKAKAKSPKTPEKSEILDKLAIDPKIFKNLATEYQRLLNELQRSSKSPDTDSLSLDDPLIDDESPMEQSPERTRIDNKRKSPQRSDDCKKFKEEASMDISFKPEVQQATELVEEDSVLARLERKYRRGSLKTIEEVVVPPDSPTAIEPKLPVEVKELPKTVAGTPQTIEDKPEESYSVIERLEMKLRKKRELAAMAQEEQFTPALKETTKLDSTALVKQQENNRKENKSEQLPQENKLAKAKLSPPKVQEVNSFEHLLSLPKENIDDIFTEFEMTEKETEKALKEFQESFDQIAEDEIEVAPVAVKMVEVTKKPPMNGEMRQKSKPIEVPVKVPAAVKPDDVKPAPKKSPIKAKPKAALVKSPSKESSNVQNPEAPTFSAETPKTFKSVKSPPKAAAAKSPVKESLTKAKPAVEPIESVAKPKVPPVKAKRKTPPKAKLVEQILVDLPKENDFSFSYEPVTSPQMNESPATSSKVIQQEKIVNKPETIEADLKAEKKQNRNSLHMDLAEIDFGIAERPLDITNFFPRRSSIEEIPDSPKSSNSIDETKLTSGRDSAYSGSRKSSAGEKEIETAQKAIPASYMNVLKEISCGLYGFDDEPLILMDPPLRAELEKVKAVIEPPKQNAEETYTKVLQDISSTLVGLDLHGVDTPKPKNYSQIIPPFVQDQFVIKKMASTNSLEVPSVRSISDFTQNANDDALPVPPTRRHKSIESTDTPEVRIKRTMPASKSFDYETISGRTSKNSTEYYEHYVPPATSGRRAEKYDPEARKDSLEGIRTRTRQRAIDDLMVKSTRSRLYDDDTPVRRPYDDISTRRPYGDSPVRTAFERREGSMPSESILSEKSQQLHKKKESFMRDQMTESANPYIREMMRQDVDNPIDITDIKFIRNHPTAALPSSHTSSYQRPSSYVPRTTSSYSKPSVLSSSHAPISTSSYSRPSAVYGTSAYKTTPSSSLGYLSPSSNTAAHILTKSHTLSPSTNAYAPRRPITSLSDAHPSSTSRYSSHSRPTTSYSQKKTAGSSSRDACAQTDSDSSDEALNSATEISTDSEFDQDPVNHDPPKIFIDDSHLRRHRVQMKANHNDRHAASKQHQDVHLKFKPLVEVDPTIVKREPLKNPLPGNFLLSKTASTEGIASKKSLELKKRYLLGEAGNANAVMKSDSASALDSKLKSFHSNISECQKLLNPAAEISPSMQTFLQRIDRNNELNRSQHSITLSKINKDKFNNNQEEKENRSIDSNKKLEYSETVNTALIENKIRELSPEVSKEPEVIEIVDLVTPEKKQPIIDLAQVEIPKSTIDENKQFIENMEKSTSAHEVNMKIKTKLDSMFIDLTVDSPPKDKHSLEANNNTTSVPDILSSLTLKSPKEEENLERPRSPAHETTIEVPQIWTKAPKDVDTDSLSNASSTSSLEDIPHFILDSATSPETLNDNVNFQAPRLEVRDSAGELMQIDSLMIIDGQYVGDPDDLHLFKDKLPEKAAEPVIIEPEAPPASLSRPTFKFDSRNENKLESLINLPLIVAKEEVLQPKPLQLRFSDKKSPVTTPDGDKTPMAGAPIVHSDSENDITGQGLTETELSDWTEGDVLSENFVDFALNSGKGTIKKKKVRSRKNGHNGVSHPKNSPVKAKLATSESVECGILKNLACGEIDFMDTGSEDSCVETLSTTNRAMLKNRGYVKFVDHQHSLNQHTPYNAYAAPPRAKERSPPIVEAINIEVVNVDFIEQGACILNNDLQTPVNEDPPDSLNVLSDEIDEDSLVVIEDKNQLESLQTTTTTTETTEELTIVTSPESLPRNTATPVNTTTPSSTVITSDSTPDREQEPLRFDRSAERASSGSRVSREQIEEMGGYEEYVKSLQMKIAQISSGRESLEKKSRRKLSKSDLLGDDSKPSDANKSIFSPATQVEPPQTLSMKLEELTKERTKQKDIIHDLVMDKLQAKKQLNAEKRMNRSRNRNLFMGTGAGSFPLSPIKTPDSTPEPPKHVITYRESVNNLKEFDDKSTLNGSTEVAKPFAEPMSVSKLSKTQSFNYYTKHIPLKDDDANFKTPVPPPRNRVDSSSDLTHTAEKMREDARARARLKSNEDLGLSPEEKILMLRRRYNLMQHSDMQPSSSLYNDDRNKSDDVKFREKKLSSSKSFNDISRMQRYSKDISDGLRNHPNDFMSDPNLAEAFKAEQQAPKSAATSPKITKSQRRDSERRKSIIQTVSDFFHKKKDQSASNKDLTSSSPTSASKDRLSETSSTTSMFSRFRLSPKSKEQPKDKAKEKDATPPYTGERSKSVSSLKYPQKVSLTVEKDQAPPIPPLPLNYQRSDDEGSFQTNESRNELKKLRAMSKASKQAELKRLRIAQEIKREQDEIDLKIKDLETRGVELEKMLRGEGQNIEQLNESSLSSIGSSDEDLLKELLDIWRNITQYKKRDEELIIRQQELQLEHRHAQLKEELSVRLSCSKLDKSAQDVAAEGAILSEMLEIVAKRAALRPSDASMSLSSDQVSLPVLPPQTTINPLHQQYHAHSSQRYQSSMAPSVRNIHTFSSQSHNQEHET